MTVVTIKDNASETDESNQQMKDLQSMVASLKTIVESVKRDNEVLKQENESLKNALKKRDDTIEVMTRQLNKLNNDSPGCCILNYMKCFRKAPSQRQLEESTTTLE